MEPSRAKPWRRAEASRPNLRQYFVHRKSNPRLIEPPLYRTASWLKDTDNVVKDIFSQGIGAVQVNDVNLNAWACSVGRWSDGQLHFRNSKYGKCYTGVNTWVWNDQVQKYTRDRSVPTTDGVQIPRTTARFKSIMDFMATRRVAA